MPFKPKRVVAIMYREVAKPNNYAGWIGTTDAEILASMVAK